MKLKEGVERNTCKSEFMQEKGFFREIYRPLQNIFTKGVFQSQIFRTLVCDTIHRPYSPQKF